MQVTYSQKTWFKAVAFIRQSYGHRLIISWNLAKDFTVCYRWQLLSSSASNTKDRYSDSYACFTNCISLLSFTSSPKANPPASVNPPKFTPKSVRLILPVTVKPAFSLPK